MSAEDIREMSFQNVLDTILKPAGIKVGGYPEDLFVDLQEEEREKWNCNICYLLVREARECSNKHLFCNTCVFAWSLTYGENSQKCPMCRVNQRDYEPNKQVNTAICDKQVKCPDVDCSFQAPLKVFLMHSHGKELYANYNQDLESLRPPHAGRGPNLIILPGGVPLNRDLLGGAQRAVSIREQLHEGRAMINQMMLLIHLEVQLRQQALVSYNQSQNPNIRIRRFDEVLALNEQLNEVGTILSALLTTPLASRARSRVIAPLALVGAEGVEVSREVMLSRGGVGRTVAIAAEANTTSHGAPLGAVVIEEQHEDNDSSSASDATSISSVSTIAPRIRMSLTGSLHTPNDTLGALESPRRLDQHRPLRHGEIRSQLRSRVEADEVRTPRLNLRQQNVNRQGSISDIAIRNDNTNVSVQSLDASNSICTSAVHSNNSPRLRHPTTLPPLLGLSGMNSSRNSQERDSGQESSPRGLLPTGSSVHQQAMRALSHQGNTEDTDTITDHVDEDSMQRPNSVARPRHLHSINAIRGPHITSEGVTASGATFSASADTPLTRASLNRQGVMASGATFSASADRPLTHASLNRQSTTASGASFSTNADTPSIHGSLQPPLTDSLSITPLNALETPSRDPPITTPVSTSIDLTGTNNTAMSATIPIRTPGRQNKVPISESQSNSQSTTTTVAAPRGTRTQAPSYAHRRLRRDSLPAAVIPYVPHRSTSPPRARPHVVGNRTQSQSLHQHRRANTSNIPPEVRGGAELINTSLPTTPGQLMRARQSRRRARQSGNPGDTI